jgi:hypothetical protein
MLIKEEFKKLFINKLNLIRNNKYLTFIAIFLLMSALMCTLAIIMQVSASTLKASRSDTIQGQLDAMHIILKEVASNPSNSKREQIALEGLEVNILSVQKSLVNVAKSSDIQQVSKQISLVKDDIDSQMVDLKKSVSSSFGNKEYLDASNLPFHVISIDVIGGEPYVSINYADHVSPLGIGDLLVGWRVASADSDQGVAVFINEKNQFVRISLQGV